ncbi:hypothetical protein V8E36_006603 [Tilletia maclaganii]
MVDAPSSPPGGPSSSQPQAPALSEHEEILLRSAIRRILENADLSSISAKNVREELLDIQSRQASHNGAGANGATTLIVPPSLNIMSHKKQLNALVKQCFEEVSAQKEQEAAAAAALAAVSAGAHGGAGWANGGRAGAGAGAVGGPGQRPTFATGGIALPGIGAAPPVTHLHPSSAAASTSASVARNPSSSSSSSMASSSTYVSAKKRKREDGAASLLAAAAATAASSPAPSSAAATPSGYGDEDIEAELASLDDDTVRTSRSKKLKKTTSKVKREPNPNNPFNRPLVLSAQMAEICGSAELSRPQIVKQLWAYIKGNDLQNPSNKRQILCDPKLQNLFGKPMVDSFEMAKLIGKHIKKKEDLI